jgi:AraC-like DNA-binding protein
MAKKTIQSGAFSTFRRLAEDNSHHDGLNTATGFILFQGRRIDRLDGIDITTPVLVENLHLMRIKGGELSISANLMPHTFSEGDVLLIGPGTIYQVERYTSATLCDILVIDVDTARYILGSRLPEYASDTPVFIAAHPSEQELQVFDAIFLAILKAVHADMADTSATESLLSAAIHFFTPFYQRQAAAAPSSRQQEIFVRFLRLVSQHSRDERHIGYYADLMALSQDHLSRIVREHSGITCKEWIERAVLMEAKVLLRHTDRTITDISEALHFPNDSFFCKYFKRLIGMTPRRYRERG